MEEKARNKICNVGEYLEAGAAKHCWRTERKEQVARSRAGLSACIMSDKGVGTLKGMVYPLITGNWGSSVKLPLPTP